MSQLSRWLLLRPQLRKTPAAAWKYLKTHRLLVLGVVGALFAVVTVAAIVTPSAEPEEETVAPEPLEVTAIRFGQTEVFEESVGMVKNLESITLVAQSAGPVSQVKVVEGQTVTKGQVLMTQETAYAAGNAATVQRQIAGKNYQLASETLTSTVTTVSLQREQANTLRDNTEELRKISEQSIEETKSLIGLIEEQLKYTETQLEAAPTEAIAAEIRGGLIALQSQLNGARSQLRQLEYQVDTDSPQSQLADMQRELVHQTTELQLKSAQIQKEIAGLSWRAAKIAEATTRVTAPFGGVIEKVYLVKGEYVTPGTAALVLRGGTKLSLQVAVSGSLAARIDDSGSLTVKLGSETISLPITHVSRTPVQGQLYEVLALIPENYLRSTYEDATVPVTLPLYSTTVVEGNYFVPLDSVYVTTTSRYVLIEENGVARQRVVETGEIVGGNIEIKSGLLPGDVVILDRRAVEGQQVKVRFVTRDSLVIELG